MEVVKESKEYKVFKKRSGRFAVRNSDRKWINGDEKVQILLKEKLIKLSAPKKKEEPAPAESAETTAPEAAKA